MLSPQDSYLQTWFISGRQYRVVEGMDKNPPKNALNWKREKWDGSDGTKGAHPNSRFTRARQKLPLPFRKV
jgi:GTP-dependent phosphoenolpyruvate carboxykinase